jgi:hypothetical protein
MGKAMQDLQLTISIDVLAIAFVTALAAWLFRRSLSPIFRLNVSARWVSDTLVVLRLEIENISSVITAKRVVRLQALPYPENEELSEWVPFDSARQRRDEKPLKWREPIDIFQSTRRFFPRESVVVERLHKCPRGQLLHVGMQIRRKWARPIENEAGALWRWMWQSQTTTVIVRRSEDG